MDLSWTEEQLAIRNGVIEFAHRELNDDLLCRDRAGAFSRELWQKCADFGIQGLAMPAEYGGQGVDMLTAMLATEGLGYGCKDNGLVFGISAQVLSVQMPILGFGSEAQKRKYLPKMCSGEWIGAHAMTEPDSGSDAFSLNTTAEPLDDCYVLNGTKTFVTNAPVADLFLVFATVNKQHGFMGVTAFIVDGDLPGIQVGRPMEKMGLKTVPLAQVYFEDCRVPAESRLGAEGNGAAIFKDSMEWERGCILANYLGGMKRQLETCTAYAQERKQFKRPIGKFQSVANKLVDMKVRMETARLLLYKAVWTKTNGGDASVDTAIAKLYLSEAWIQSCLDAVQIHGGYGYMTEVEVERDLRDSVSGAMYSGTSEIQRNIIAGHLGL